MTGAGAVSGGIYVHFPYCAHHCAYCDFAVATPQRIPVRAYTDAVLAELRLRAGDLEGPARSLYLGGGTPSLWDPVELERLFAAVRESPGLEGGAEVTLEANPDDVDPDRLARLLDLGVTRLSLGVQALRDDLLLAADRRHDAKTALRALESVAAAGFRSWSFDLMFGLPGQTLASWRRDLETAASLGAPHLSVYALTVEPRTTLARAVAKGEVHLPGDDAQADMLLATRDVLGRAGFVHYEVSSHALPGHRAVHNSGYWEMRPWLGLGAAAHGFLPALLPRRPLPRRTVNHRRPSRYVAAALAGDPTAETLDLSADTAAFERLMTGLRDLERGVLLPPADAPRFAAAAALAASCGHVALCPTEAGLHLRLTEAGLLVLDDVLLGFLP